MSRKVALWGQKLIKKVILNRKVALRGQKFSKKINLGRKVALWGQKFIKKVTLGRKNGLGRKIQRFLDRFKTCFDTAKSKISKNAAIPAIQYGFTKQKHIRGDKTLKIYNFGPNVIYKPPPNI